jgi:hypothetical protein
MRTGTIKTSAGPKVHTSAKWSKTRPACRPSAHHLWVPARNGGWYIMRAHIMTMERRWSLLWMIWKRCINSSRGRISIVGRWIRRRKFLPRKTPPSTNSPNRTAAAKMNATNALPWSHPSHRRAMSSPNSQKTSQIQGTSWRNSPPHSHSRPALSVNKRSSKNRREF